MRLVLAISLLAACTSTNTVAIRDAGSLREARHGGDFDAGGARISPNSKLRFCRADNCSDWITASDLRVDETGAWLGATKAGYLWRDVERVEVKGFDGLKTTGAIVGISAAVVAVIPIIALAALLRIRPGNDGGAPPSFPEAKAAAVIGGAVVAAAVEEADTVETDEPGGWYASARTLRQPPRLFTLGARVRSVITLGAVADGGATVDGELVTAGALARLRLGDFLELGGGARHARSRIAGHDTANWYVAQGGFHAPITANVALSVGLDVAWGGEKALSNQITAPIGLRLSVDRWSATLRPLSPSWVKRDGDWKFATFASVELGVTL